MTYYLCIYHLSFNHSYILKELIYLSMHCRLNQHKQKMRDYCGISENKVSCTFIIMIIMIMINDHYYYFYGYGYDYHYDYHDYDYYFHLLKLHSYSQ